MTYESLKYELVCLANQVHKIRFLAWLEYKLLAVPSQGRSKLQSYLPTRPRPFRWSLNSHVAYVHSSIRTSICYKKISRYSAKTNMLQNMLQHCMGPGGSLNSPNLFFFLLLKSSPLQLDDNEVYCRSDCLFDVIRPTDCQLD